MGGTTASESSLGGLSLLGLCRASCLKQVGAKSFPESDAKLSAGKERDLGGTHKRLI